MSEYRSLLLQSINGEYNSFIQFYYLYRLSEKQFKKPSGDNLKFKSSKLYLASKLLNVIAILNKRRLSELREKIKDDVTHYKFHFLKSSKI